LHVIKDYSATPEAPICLHENRFFRMMFNGRFHYLDGVRYGRGAVVVPVMLNGDLLLVCQQRAPAIGMSWEFPRGGVDAEESVPAGACRELREETGFEAPVAAVQRLGAIAQDTATLNGHIEAYRVDVPFDTPVVDFDHNEIAHVQRVSQPRFEQMLAAGEVTCGISQAAWALFLAQRGEGLAEQSAEQVSVRIVRALDRGDSLEVARLASVLARRGQRCTLPLHAVLERHHDALLTRAAIALDSGLPL
jgi:ADP-ribose pyrophosphatase